jgi:hypothetical protein
VPPVPVAYDSPRFWEEVREVRRVAAGLTPAQKAIADVWNLGQATITPPGVWNLKAADLARDAGLDAATSLRAFATLNVAMADAFIACWHAKFKWRTIRPISVIRERDDPEFLSYLVTPPFPSHPSGHATASIWNQPGFSRSAPMPSAGQPLETRTLTAARWSVSGRGGGEARAGHERVERDEHAPLRDAALDLHAVAVGARDRLPREQRARLGDRRAGGRRQERGLLAAHHLAGDAGQEKEASSRPHHGHPHRAADFDHMLERF